MVIRKSGLAMVTPRQTVSLLATLGWCLLFFSWFRTDLLEEVFERDSIESETIASATLGRSQDVCTGARLPSRVNGA